MTAGGVAAPAMGLKESRRPVGLGDLAWQRFRRHRPAIGGGLVLLALVATCVLAPFAAPGDVANLVDPLGTLEPPSRAHPFGTDDVGRDIMWRVVYGGRISLVIGLFATLIAMTVGVTVGCLSGFYGGLVDNVLMRITDTMLSVPTLFLLIIMTKVIGPSVPTMILVIGIVSWMQVSRIVRATFMSLKSRDFIVAARSVGVTNFGIMTRHMLPNALAPVVVAATLLVGNAIIVEASASFLGLGVQPPTSSWGSMLNRAQSLLTIAPWVAIFPGLVIVVTVLSTNFIGDGLRDALDPHIRL